MPLSFYHRIFISLGVVRRRRRITRYRSSQARWRSCHRRHHHPNSPPPAAAAAAAAANR